MDKIIYNLVFNRKKLLNKKGQALVQVEAYLNRKKIFFYQNLFTSRSMGSQKENSKKSSECGRNK